MKVLIACEESQVVCKAFREKGHEAYSCDILECSGGHPEWHIQGDVLPLLNGTQDKDKGILHIFETQDGKVHNLPDKWDLIIAHPPCTRLCNSGQRWLYWGDDKYKSQKIAEQQKAIVFFMMFALADCDKIVIENPQGIMSTAYRKPDCVYNPYDFEGETECKKTCLWLKGVESLKPTRKVALPKEERTQGIWKAHFGNKKLAWNDPRTARLRSQTPVGVAQAMAEQWG
jgi:site-specific DNA-cytosine methylase